MHQISRGSHGENEREKERGKKRNTKAANYKKLRIITQEKDENLASFLAS